MANVEKNAARIGSHGRLFIVQGREAKRRTL
jgi:hypothetical protein